MSSTPRNAGRPRRAPKPSIATLEAEHRQTLAGHTATITLLQEQLEQAQRGTVTEESISDLERAVSGDPVWRRFATLAEQEFTPDGMVHLRAACRFMALKNPLIVRGLSLRRVYVHGQGYEIRARATGRTPKDSKPEQDVNAVIDRFIRDAGNQRTVFGQQAANELENAVATDGEVFLALFTRPESGWVQVRAFAANEIADVITNPDDKSEPWFYRRRWRRATRDEHGNEAPEEQEELYPDIDYRPARRPSHYAGVRINWWAPVLHVAVNRPLDWLRGIPDVYPAIDWTRAHKEFLEQWATLMKSLARFAWRMTAEGRQKPQTRAALAAAGQSMNVVGDRQDIGGTAIMPFGSSLEAIPKNSATIDAESGRPLAMMIAAALGVPVTMLLSDPGQTGARATAETLDWPTELVMLDRRELWSTVRLQICRYVIRESVRAAQGPLKGTVKRDRVTGREIVVLADDTDDTVDIEWPPLTKADPAQVIGALVQANSTGTLPPDLMLRQLLAAIGIRDAESIVDQLVDDDGVFQWPQTAQSAQQAAAGVPGQAPDGAGTVAGGEVPGGPGPDGEITAVPVDGMAGRQADADFGLGGGSGATDQDVAPPQPGPVPGPAEFDPLFYSLDGDVPDQGPADVEGEPVLAEEDPAVPDPTDTPGAVSQGAAARQADADFGLGGTKTPADDGTDQPAGDIPEPGEFDLEFYKL